jgi:hypothetical protein
VESFLLQDFVSLKTVAGTQIVQTATSWMDIGDIEDLILITDVREASNAAQLGFDTAATPQESAFVQLIAPFTLSVGVQTNSFLAAFAGVPPARFLRWRFVGPVGAQPPQATFRIWGTGYRWA